MFYYSKSLLLLRSPYTMRDWQRIGWGHGGAQEALIWNYGAIMAYYWRARFEMFICSCIWLCVCNEVLLHAVFLDAQAGLNAFLGGGERGVQSAHLSQQFTFHRLRPPVLSEFFEHKRLCSHYLCIWIVAGLGFPTC